MTKAVLDTNVLISATFWPGASHQITVLAIQKKIQCFTSAEILEEYARILERDFHQTKEQIEEKARAILLFHELVRSTTKIEIVKEDPDDNKIIEAAVAANADYIVTGDRHLLNIEEYGGIQIVKPEQFLRTIR